MLPIADSIIRIVNFMFLTIVLGLTSSLIESQKHTNSRVNFALFASVFGLVFSSFYGLLANFIEFLAWPVILVALDFLNFVFTFSAATALAVGTRTHSCTNQSYLDSNKITEGSTDRCRKAQASTAFLYFSFFLFIASGAISIMSLLNGGAFGSRRPRKSTGVPTISTA